MPERYRLLCSRAVFLSHAIEAKLSLYLGILLHMALEGDPTRETPRKPGGGAPDHHLARSAKLDGCFWKDAHGGILRDEIRYPIVCHVILVCPLCPLCHIITHGCIY